MRRTAALLLAAVLAAPAAARAPAPRLHECQLALHEPAGTLIVTSWVPHRGEIRRFSLYWYPDAPDLIARLGFLHWEGNAVTPPPDNLRVTVSFTAPEGRWRQPLRLELRGAGADGTEAVLFRGAPVRNSVFLFLSPTWGDLRARTQGLRLGAVVADRDGREVARHPLPSAPGDAPAAAIAAGRSRWEALNRDPTLPCPEGTQEMVRIVVRG
jgi:hypothetical protein